MDIGRAIISRTRPFQDNVEVLVEEQGTNDIIQAILTYHLEDKRDYDKICMLFDADSAEEIGYNIWTFLRKNVRNVTESEELQTIRTPGALVSTGKTWGADCKNYSLFAGGVIDALNRRGAGIDWCYRFASYKFFKPSPYHVFVVMFPGSDDEIWIDAVLSQFDYKKWPTHFKDKKMLARVSGMGNLPQYAPVATMGDDDDDDYTYDDGSDTYADPTTASTTDAGSSSGFDLSSSAGASLATQANPTLSSSIVNPSSTATALTPTDAGGFDYNSTTGEYEAVNPDGSLLSNSQSGESTAPATSSNPISSFLNALTGGGGSGSGSGSGSSAQKSQTPTTPGVTTNVTVPSSSSNTTLYIILGAVAILGVVLLTRKK